MMYKVTERFVSINGEGQRAGQLAVFIRFKGCNLNCSYCDTAYANEEGAAFEPMSKEEIYSYIKSAGIKNCTLTGGEPLIQEDIGELLRLLGSDKSLRVEIETNGSIDLAPFAAIDKRPVFTMDYKQPDSGMESFMKPDNFKLLKACDTVKFVSGSHRDLERAKEIIVRYGLLGKCGLYISPVFGKIEPAEIVDFLIKNRMNDVNVQLQLHKYIWDANARGV